VEREHERNEKRDMPKPRQKDGGERRRKKRIKECRIEKDSK